MDQEEICRTCLCTNSNFTPVEYKTSYLGQSFTISRMIMACAPVEISAGDGLPAQVCEICLKLLYVSFIFRIRILQANEKLKYYLRTKMVPDLQPVSEGFIEPLVLPSLLDDINIKQIFSMLHSTENDADPLTADPFNLANFSDQTDIKTEIKSETLPIEEVLLSSDNTNDFEIQETADSEPVSVNMPQLHPIPTMANASYTSPENIPNQNSSHQSQSLSYETNLNIETILTDTDISNLTENDTNLIQSVIQSFQNKTSTSKNTKFIIINANPTNNLLNNDSITPMQPILKKYMSNTNLPYNKKMSASNCVQSTSLLKNKEKQTCTQNKDIPSTSLSLSSNNLNNVSNEIIPNKPFLKKPESHNFEGELMRFVEAREKYLENRPDYPPPRTYTRRKKLADSIDLTNDDSVDNINNIHKTAITQTSCNSNKLSNKIVNRHAKIGYINKYIPNNSEVSAPTFFAQMPQNGNKVMRLIVDENQDQSSSIIIDD